MAQNYTHIYTSKNNIHVAFLCYFMCMYALCYMGTNNADAMSSNTLISCNVSPLPQATITCAHTNTSMHMHTYKLVYVYNY